MLVGSNGEERTRITSVRVPMRYMCVVVELAQRARQYILDRTLLSWFSLHYTKLIFRALEKACADATCTWTNGEHDANRLKTETRR